MINFALIYCDVKYQIFFHQASINMFHQLCSQGLSSSKGKGRRGTLEMMLTFNCDDFFRLHNGTAFIAFGFGSRVSYHYVFHPCVSGHK